ncbi:Ribulose-5-phosphate 4-epimerase and related epimerases and aldolases [Sphingobacterium spiritivorum]|uniref:Ribulose-5-phosphate 4-epimerase and related epimerases and aldolases n=1 Tax=Sphingobacterium spiritivorum TaxID=258 RepID=A0A380BBI6_SPHSI|nr:ankyrin repeat domain-containing protein [Sphingobacterium spiritivorum]SUI98093.1 Ribulose-5-phosphate 4-epimerase and related epimerases and aldolases [Sphingobacterium spiritivorum]
MNHFLLIFSIIFLNACEADMKTETSSQLQTSIVEAVKANQLAEVESLLKNGANVNSKDKNAKSLLLIATQSRYIEMARLLVNNGADVNLQDDIFDSPFLYAGAAGYTELVQLFLENGARFDVYNRYHGTALIPACERGHLDVVKLLSGTPKFPINHINRLGWTALMEAVVLGNGSEVYVEIVNTLVKAGCDINIPDKDNVTALEHAKARGYTAIAQILENAGKR